MGRKKRPGACGSWLIRSTVWRLSIPACRAMTLADLGAFRGIRHECSIGTMETDLVRHAFARAIDVVRALVGEIDALTASGNPAGEHPDIELVVQLRSAQGRQAEVRIWSG